MTIFDRCSHLDSLSLEFACNRLFNRFGCTAAPNHYAPITYIFETGDDRNHLTLTPLCLWTIQWLLIGTPPTIGSFVVTWLSPLLRWSLPPSFHTILNLNKSFFCSYPCMIFFLVFLKMFAFFLWTWNTQMLSMLSLGMVFFFRGSWCHTDEPCSLLAVTDAIINGASSSEIITFYSASLCLLNSITLQSSPNRHVSKPNYYWQSRHVPSFSFPVVSSNRYGYMSNLKYYRTIGGVY